MDYLKDVLYSLLALLVLFLLTKLIGNRSISELTMFDYVTGISIGSIAAEMATELERPLKPLVAMVVFGIAAYLISLVTSKSLRIRRIVLGRPVLLMRNGKLHRKNLKKSNMDLSELLMQCRTAGYFDISAINTVILEPSGKLSILPFSNKRPITAEDLKVLPVSDSICRDVIMDGEVLHENLKSAGKDINWLKSELKLQGIKSFEGVFLATLDENDTLSVFCDDGTELFSPFE